MTFATILSSENNPTGPVETPEAPTCFGDLNLDQIVAAVTAGKQEYNLAPFYYTPLRDAAEIGYRQEVMRDLENQAVMKAVQNFAKGMRMVRRYLALGEQFSFHYHKEGWLLEAALVYMETVSNLAQALGQAPCASRGLAALRTFLSGYCAGAAFQALEESARRVKAGLAGVRYCVILKGSKVQVRRAAGETDYGIEVEKTFAKFQQGAVKNYRINLSGSSGMNHIAAQILDLAAKLYPDAFADLDQFCAHRAGFVEPALLRFDREIQFYVAYLEYIERFRPALKFAYPGLSSSHKEISVKDGFDLALAGKRQPEDVVTNDFFLSGLERILVVSGPNQGGKTTFARMFGQLHYLASLGCPVPARQAELVLFDQIFTHFEKEEDIRSLSGKLQDDLLRVQDILQLVSPDSILIMNEIFNSTTLQDAVFLSQKIMAQIDRLDLVGVWVTFVDELAAYSEMTVSLVSTVVPDNPAERTYKIIRQPSDGLAYALSIAEKHRLTYVQIKERMQL
jgi:DNA mismatch repair protein MutS